LITNGVDVTVPEHDAFEKVNRDYNWIYKELVAKGLLLMLKILPVVEDIITSCRK
jgi:hypothetical protein